MYAVQVCMPGRSYDTARGWGSLSNQFDIFASIVRGTHTESRKGMTVRLITRTADSFRVIKRVRIV